MALTITTDLTVIASADTLTGWTNFGAGGTGTEALETDFFIQGTGCISRGVTGVGTEKGMCFDATTGLNFTTTHAGKLIYIWMRTNVVQLCDTRANGGVRIVIGSGATAPAAAAGVWSAWNVDGSDTITGETGWKCYVIDPTLLPTSTFGGGVDMTSLRWFGGTMKTTATAKGQNFGIDQISYGLGELRCRGTNTTSGAGFTEMNTADYGTVGNRYGVLSDRAGILYVNGKLVIGDGVSTNATTFTSEDEILVWERRTYYDGTGERACVKDLNPNTGLPYHGLDFRGNGTGDTIITFGQKVGTGTTASGRNGPLFTGHRGTVAFDFDDGSVEATKIYGTTFKQIRGGIDMSANAAGDEFIGNTLVGCGSFQAGPVTVLACNFIANTGGANKIFEDFINDAAAAEALAVADPMKSWLNVAAGTFWNCPVKVNYVELQDPGGADTKEVVQLEAIDSAALTVTVAAAGGTYTRSAGSYITDLFRVGQTVTWSGFTNAGNNATKVILALSATVMTTSTTGLINETGNGDERVIDSSGVGSDDHYAECILRWPSAGSLQGAMGPTIRGAAATTASYWYLKCDLRNNQITLISTTTGTDTTVVGPTTYTFAEDTDYMVQLIGRGTIIEGFVDGYKMATTSATHQTNRRVGIRGDARNDQVGATGELPRLRSFAAGPITDKLGALVVLSATDSFGTSNFINNARALGLQTTGTYSSTNNNFSGNLVDIRDDSSGATTVNVTGTGGAPLLTSSEEVDDAVTTISASVTITITVKNSVGVAIQNARVAVYKSSDNTELINSLTDASGIVTNTFAFASNTDVYIRIRKTSTGTTRYINNDASGTITSAGLTATYTLLTDTIASV